MSRPTGHTFRPMVLEDAGLIAERSAAYTSALLGFAKRRPEDVANYAGVGMRPEVISDIWRRTIQPV